MVLISLVYWFGKLCKSLWLFLWHLKGAHL